MNLALSPRPARRPRLGLALGSGSARGWAHIGIIRALEEAGYVPDVICGTSIGALVGAVHAAGQLDWLEGWVQDLKWQGVVDLMDLKMSGGLIAGTRLTDFFRAHFKDEGIENLPRPYACVATELASGREVWLREGSVIEAVRASIALPGLFTPAEIDERLLVDGGLVNPVPVSLCRAMGADVVIAVDLNWDLIGRHARSDPRPLAETEDGMLVDTAPSLLTSPIAALMHRFKPAPRAGGGRSGVNPSMMDVLVSSLNIMQVRITQSRLAGEPADVVVRPRLSDITAMDFHRASLAIAQGKAAVQAALPTLHYVLGDPLAGSESPAEQPPLPTD